MSDDSLSSQKMRQSALEAAIERAIKAEKAYLNLKLESYIEKMQNATNVAEQEYIAKKNLYSNLPDQERRLKDEFQKRTSDINMRIDSAKEIHAMCLGALDKGFCMDELPLNSTDSNEVRTIINNLLRSKERRENVGDKHDSYGSKIATDPGGMQNGYMAYAQGTTSMSPNRTQRPLLNNGGNLSTPSSQLATSTAFASGQPLYSPQPDSALSQYYGSEQQRRTGQSQRLLANQVYLPQQLSHQSNPRGIMMNGSNALGVFSAKSLTNGQAVGNNQHLLAMRALSGSQPTKTTSSVNDLDNFVIDDEMFSATPSTQMFNDANIHNGATAKPLEKTTKLIENLPSASSDVRMDSVESIEETMSDAGSDETEHSISDDEEFATRSLAISQGSSSSIANKPKEIAKETALIKKDPLDSVDWNAEPWLNIVQQSSVKFKINKKAATHFLQAALNKVGDISQLDAVWAEAERSISKALKPAPLASKQEVSVSTSKPTSSNEPISSGPLSSALSSTAPASTATIVKAPAGTVSAIKAPTSATSKPAVGSSNRGYSNYKTVMCKDWLQNKKCPRKEYCTFAHGKGDLKTYLQPQLTTPAAPRHSFYKVIECKHYKETQRCNWGDQCIFAHGKEELRDPSANDELSDSTAQTVDPNEPHAEPCEGQQCPHKLEFLLKKTRMCPRHKDGLCKFDKDCKFAHSRKELKPMPKWEMCQRYLVKKCMHMQNPERCVYAHSKEELRSKPAEMKVNKKAQGTVTGGRPIPPGSRYVPWAGQDKHPNTTKDGEECLICMGPLMASEKKNLLKCGHNTFHERCISQWVNEGRPSCPVCREPASLPDLFKAPAGFQPEEFPGLGL